MRTAQHAQDRRVGVGGGNDRDGCERDAHLGTAGLACLRMRDVTQLLLLETWLQPHNKRPRVRAWGRGHSPGVGI